jgi:hypothetical protein
MQQLHWQHSPRTAGVGQLHDKQADQAAAAAADVVAVRAAACRERSSCHHAVPHIHS